MKVLVTGAQGQLSTSLREVAAGRPGVTIQTIGRPALELSDPESVRDAIVGAEPDIVVSAAAYTAVDRAEDEPDLARRINVGGAASVAAAAAALGVPVIHISTDYVFAGEAAHAYDEQDATGPKTVYGRTKLEGERAVASVNPRHIILRTSWVYSPFGTNFVRTMLRLATERDTIAVVADQWGNPTSALDLAAAVLRVAEHPARATSGVYHVTGTGETNWAGFARHVFRASKAAGGPHARVEDIASSAYRTKAARPLNSRLSCDKFERTFGWRAPPWPASTDAVVRRLVDADYRNHLQRTDV